MALPSTACDINTDISVLQKRADSLPIHVCVFTILSVFAMNFDLIIHGLTASVV
jgi:hypothetical protein